MATEIGLPKSDPGFYREAVARLGYRPDEAVMVGDSYENDVVAAKRAGLKAVRFAPDAAGRTSTGDRQRPAPSRPGDDAYDAMVTDLRDLPGAVRLLQRSASGPAPEVARRDLVDRVGSPAEIRAPTLCRRRLRRRRLTREGWTVQ